jgi:integrase
MTHENQFSVRRFRNRNGVFSFRVDGRLNGVRIRRNVKTLEGAALERAALELKGLQLASNLRSVTTILTEEQVREAEAAFRRLADNGRNLGFYLDYALQHYPEPVIQKPLSEAADAYLAAKSLEHDRQVNFAPQLTTIRRHLEVLKAHFPAAAVAELSAPRLKVYFQHGNPAPKTYNNRRGVVSTFLKFAFQQDWIAVNPIEKVAYQRIAHRRGSAPTLRAKQAQDLMAYEEGYRDGTLVPFFALCLFAGIRPCLRTGEILKLRPQQVSLDTGVIHIEPEVSKVRMKRNVTIQPNLAAWLRAYPLDRFPIMVPNLQKQRAGIAKLFGLSHDVMRHTFISFFVGKYRSMGEAALQA